MTADTAAEDKGFYESKGYIRHMLILPAADKDKLKKLAKQFGITQGEVVEVLLAQMDLDDVAPHFEAVKAKKAGPTTKSELIRKMKDLTPDQLAKIASIIEPSTTQ